MDKFQINIENGYQDWSISSLLILPFENNYVIQTFLLYWVPIPDRNIPKEGQEKLYCLKKF